MDAQRLLDLMLEYAQAVESRAAADLGGVPTGREPEEIAAEYSAELARLTGQ